MASKTTQAVTAAAAMALAMGCSPAPSDNAGRSADEPEPPHPRAMAHKYKQNPNPKQRYDITMTIADAPGPFESARLEAYYEAESCVFVLDRFAGVSSKPRKYMPLDLQQVSGSRYVGTVYLDAMLDDDYFGNGVCHWKLISVGVDVKATDLHEETSFSISLLGKQVLAQEVLTRYFWKGYYPKDEGYDGFTDFGEEEISHVSVEKRSEFFTMSITAEGVQP